jgi:DNA-directed RNA polymerase specialized sigma24 family protein
MRRDANPPLERLVRSELVADILEALTPAELVVALLRAEGMSDGEIGQFLDIGQWVVRQRMIRARARIEQAVPGGARLLEGRRR